jgi:membrane-associated PAP2 superfamily phosphatase
MNDAIRDFGDMSAIEAAERRERLVAAAVRGVILVWCLPFLALGYVLTLAAIALWHAVLAGEALVRWLSGSTSEPRGGRFAFSHTGTLDVLIARHGAPR